MTSASLLSVRVTGVDQTLAGNGVNFTAFPLRYLARGSSLIAVDSLQNAETAIPCKSAN